MTPLCYPPPPPPGFRLPPPLLGVLARRYGDEGGNLDFDNFISCLVRLDAMFRKGGPRPGGVTHTPRTPAVMGQAPQG